jgi:predicted Zn-dependent peptidase
MTVKKTLPNGLRVLTCPMPNTRSVTVMILCGAGSRYENEKNNGISHFLEHMFFKGAKKYKNAKEVSEAIDAVGGDFNAFTGKEYAGYYVKVAVENLDLAIEVLSDMLINSRFDEREIDKERGVILEEYNMYQDTPMYQIGWNFERLLFGDQPLGRDQIGTKELISNVKREEFVNYKRSLYTADNTVVSICGDVNCDQVMEKISEAFVFQDLKKAFDYDEYKPLGTEKIYLRNKATEQAHLVVGALGFSESSEQTLAQKLLAIIFGGNMSSRMFLSVREAKGLCYYIHSSTDDYTDVGILSTNAGVSLDRIDDAIKAILEEYYAVARDGVLASELLKAKNFLKGKMVLRLEDTEEFAHLVGKFELLYGKIYTPDMIYADVEKVSLEEVNEVAKEVLQPEKMRLAVIGPYGKEVERFSGLL